MGLDVGHHHLRECPTPSTVSLSMSSTMASSSVNVVMNDIIYNDTSGYLVMDILGSGTFGKVVKCFSLDTGKMVAIKCVNANDETIAQEVKMLKAISVFDSDEKNLVKCINRFNYNDLFCMVFEMLDQSMFQLIETRNWSPLSLNEIRPVIQQLLVSLEALKGLGIIHGDLKTDNIMLVHQENQPFKIRLIDFGLAVQASEAEVGQLLQHPAFRAPEILLGLPLTEAVDIWSLGCIMISLLLDATPFPGECDYGWMENLVSMWGEPEDHLLAAGKHSKSFFILEESKWRLMTPEEFREVNQKEPDRDRSDFVYFEDIFKNEVLSIEQDELEQKDKMEFFDLLHCCLQVDPKKRMSPSEALGHRFITMAHMEEEMETSSYAVTAQKLMSISSSISSSTECATTLKDADDINDCSDTPLTQEPFEMIRNLFHRVAEWFVCSNLQSDK